MTMKLTDSTVQKLHELKVAAQNPNLNLRVFVEGGGCSGLQYRFAFDEQINDDDFVIEKSVSSNDRALSESDKLIKLLIDPISYQYLREAEIDYVKNLQGESFKIRNPNAKTTCGCGSSFAVADEEGGE